MRSFISFLRNQNGAAGVRYCFIVTLIITMVVGEISLLNKQLVVLGSMKNSTSKQYAEAK